MKSRTQNSAFDFFTFDSSTLPLFDHHTLRLGCEENRVAVASGTGKMAYILAVGFGGFVGAITRYVLTGWIQKAFPQFPPSGTLFVNVLGCLCIGFLMTLVIDQPANGGPAWMSHSLRLFLITGILGSLTTFSTFGYETVELLREEQFRPAVWNVLANMGLGFPAVWLGRILARAAGF